MIGIVLTNSIMLIKTTSALWGLSFVKWSQSFFKVKVGLGAIFVVGAFVLVHTFE
jgi:hypothetical protein